MTPHERAEKIATTILKDWNKESNQYDHPKASLKNLIIAAFAAQLEEACAEAIRNYHCCSDAFDRGYEKGNKEAGNALWKVGKELGFRDAREQAKGIVEADKKSFPQWKGFLSAIVDNIAAMTPDEEKK